MLLAHRTLPELLPDPTDPAQLLSALPRLADDPGQARPVPLCGLADASCIPRETVRRKLERLATQGHVRKVRGGWVICPFTGAQPRNAV